MSSVTNINKDSLTPLMRQYKEIKNRYPDAILFFRLGDFYEMFAGDAQKASPILDIVLTRRQGVPMCGVPYHAALNYIARLIKAGYKVAICEQLEDPAQAKGVVRRDVIRVITPGTILEDNLLEAKRNNFSLGIFRSQRSRRQGYGLAFLDMSTGEFFLGELLNSTAAEEAVLSVSLRRELLRIRPAEIVFPASYEADTALMGILKESSALLTRREEWEFAGADFWEKLANQAGINSLRGWGINPDSLGLAAASGLWHYLESTQKEFLPPLSRVQLYQPDDYLILDDTALRTLEIVHPLDPEHGSSLLGVIDRTKTPMGARLLRRWLLQPLRKAEAIQIRQEAVAWLVKDGEFRATLQDCLASVRDIERIITRLLSPLGNPREMLALAHSLEKLPVLRALFPKKGNGNSISELPLNGESFRLPSLLTQLSEGLPDLEELRKQIQRVLVDEPPLSVKEGGIIRDGIDSSLDELRRIQQEGRSWILSLEQNERKNTGINSLKVGYNNIFGYYLEVTRPNLPLVPPDYIRKQTLTNAERFVTPELKEYEEKILGASERLIRKEEEIFLSLREEVRRQAEMIQQVARIIAQLDVLSSLAEIAVSKDYVQPIVEDSPVLLIKDGRHPVVEESLTAGAFVPNDTFLDGTDTQIMVITGPNMAGKSTYLRQVALIVVLAQMGGFVPAGEARIGLVDRIFTRIGASDNLSRGESTFMVEMQEAANILRNATSRSLLILDEIGRGTSTFDGISIARATLEFIARSRRETAFAGSSGKVTVGPRSLFATHYFELTELAGEISGIKNFNVAVKEWGEEIIFVRKLLPGPADRSYGIQVARLAGLPSEVIHRAQAILRRLENGRGEGEKPPLDEETSGLVREQSLVLPSFSFIQELQKVDPNQITPLEAIFLLSRWKEEISQKLKKDEALN